MIRDKGHMVMVVPNVQATKTVIVDLDIDEIDEVENDQTGTIDRM